MSNQFLEEAHKSLEMMRSIRRDLHRHPELGMQETRTAAMVVRHLEKLGIEVKTGIGGTGVVGFLGKKGGKTVALRADMDALPMQDQKSTTYASSIAGVAHSCGHDAHTAIQLGVAEILSRFKKDLPGNVKFIFQPSEDTLPGGALPMIADGVMEDPAFEAIFTLHLSSQFQEGTVVVKPGNASTSSTSFTLSIKGSGGHVGLPHRVVNPVLLAGTVITTTQALLPKKIAPGDPLIFEFAAIHGGTVGNIVPGEVTLKGSIRVSNPETLEEMVGHFENLVRAIVETAGGHVALTLEKGYPTIVNDLDLVNLWHSAAVDVVGEERVILHDQLITGGDDAAYFQQKVPGVYWFLGIRNEEKGFDQPLHSPYFDFNEEMLALGAAVQARVAMKYLEKEEVSQ